MSTTKPKEQMETHLKEDMEKREVSQEQVKQEKDERNFLKKLPSGLRFMIRRQK